jgi:hypothetical protein
MAVTFNIRPMVEKNSVLPMERLRVLSSFEEVRLGEIRRGVVFVFAPWSGVAVLALRRFTQVMAALDTRSLDLVVLDIDCLTSETATQLFGSSGFQAGGYGETIWVRDGTVVAREFAAPDANEPLLRRHTQELLDEKYG